MTNPTESRLQCFDCGLSFEWDGAHLETIACPNCESTDLLDEETSDLAVMVESE